jgi:hypothetical protein
MRYVAAAAASDNKEEADGTFFLDRPAPFQWRKHVDMLDLPRHALSVV